MASSAPPATHTKRYRGSEGFRPDPQSSSWSALITGSATSPNTSRRVEKGGKCRFHQASIRFICGLAGGAVVASAAATIASSSGVSGVGSAGHGGAKGPSHPTEAVLQRNQVPSSLRPHQAPSYWRRSMIFIAVDISGASVSLMSNVLGRIRPLK